MCSAMASRCSPGGASWSARWDLSRSRWVIEACVGDVDKVESAEHATHPRTSETPTSPDLQLLQALAVQCAARARGDHRNAPVKAKLLLRQLRQPLNLMRPAAERLDELGRAHRDPEPCANGSTDRGEARADEYDAPGDASLVE